MIIDSIAAALGYNEEEGKQWFVYRIQHMTEARKKLFADKEMQVYAPNLYGYVFVLSTRKQVNMLYTESLIAPIYTHHAKSEIIKDRDRYVTIPPVQMHSLMCVIENSREPVEIIAPTSEQLEKGDIVLITSGLFAGVEGTLITSQGAKGGKIFVALNQSEGITTTSIPEEHIKVLEFSRGNDHFYRKIEAFQKTLDSIIKAYQTTHLLDSNQKAHLLYFLTRYDSLRNLTRVNLAKLTVCRFAALRLLGRSSEAESCLKHFQDETESTQSGRRSARRSPSVQQYLDEHIERYRRDITL